MSDVWLAGVWLLLLALAGLVTWVRHGQIQAERAVINAMENLNHGHMLALEMLTHDVDKLKQRVEALEGR
jgi:hypothetical protein